MPESGDEIPTNRSRGRYRRGGHGQTNLSQRQWIADVITSADWEADSDNTWTVPVGGGFGKIFRIGKQPMNASVQAFYNVEKPDFGADW